MNQSSSGGNRVGIVLCDILESNKVVLKAGYVGIALPLNSVTSSYKNNAIPPYRPYRYLIDVAAANRQCNGFPFYKTIYLYEHELALVPLDSWLHSYFSIIASLSLRENKQ